MKLTSNNNNNELYEKHFSFGGFNQKLTSNENSHLKTSVKHSLPLIFRVSNEGNITISERGTIPISNQQYEAAFGISAFELYKNYPDIVNGIKSVLEGKVYWDTCEFDGPNGKTFLEFYSSPDINLNGEIEGAIGMVVDITSSMLADEILRKSEEKFRDLVENTNDWVWEVDREFKYTYCNPRIKNILGYEIDEVIGKTPFYFVETSEIEQFKNFICNKACDEPIDFGQVFITKDNKQVVIEAKGVPIFCDNNNAIGFRGIGRDITNGA